MKLEKLKTLDRFGRLWLVLGAVWLVVFGFGAAKAYYHYNQSEQMYEDARAEVVFENLHEAYGTPSSDDVRFEKEETRDGLDELRVSARDEFFTALFLLLVGPFGIYGLLYLIRWILSGAKADRP